MLKQYKRFRTKNVSNDGGCIWIFAILSLLLAGCGDRAVKEGVFQDSFVRGLSYSAPTFSGITDDSGYFQYRSGENLTFRLGSIELGSAQGRFTLTPLDLLGVSSVDNEAVINMIRLLQTLDQDNQPDNGIFISDEVQALAAVPLDFNQSVSDFEQNLDVIALINASGNQVLVSEQAAVAHFQATLTRLGINETLVVSAGVDRTVMSGDEVTLTGEVSNQSGSIIDFSWLYEQQENGIDVNFYNETELEESIEAETADGSESTFTAFSERFSAPLVTETTPFTFSFTAEDENGISVTDEVVITIEP